MKSTPQIWVAAIKAAIRLRYDGQMAVTAPAAPRCRAFFDTSLWRPFPVYSAIQYRSRTILFDRKDHTLIYDALLQIVPNFVAGRGRCGGMKVAF